MAMIPQQPEDSPTVKAIYAAYEKADAAEGRRGYLGASVIGGPCARAMWYDFRHCGVRSFDGRVLALFDTGDRAEQQFVDELRSIGCTVHEVDPETGQQFEVAAIAGHFSGHMDGAGVGVPEAPKAWHVLEFKTHNAKSFASLKSKGVAEAKPQHHAQMMVYMHLTGMRRALYLAKNKDTDERYAERVRYSKDEAEALMDRARRIIEASVPPAKISDDRDHFQCQWCDHRDRCHGLEHPNDGAAVQCTVSCRNCVHSQPEFDTDHGRWSCVKHRKTIDRHAQDAACPDHLFIPDLVTFADPVDAGYDPAGDWTEYRNHHDGAVWRNCKSGEHYTSVELTQLPGPMVGAGTVGQLMGEFGAVVEDVEDDVEGGAS